jgi:hypothetical protein
MLLHGILLHQTCSGISVLSLVRGAPVRNMPSTDTPRRSLPYGQLPSPRYRDGVIVVQPANGIIPSRLSICRCIGRELGRWVPSSPGRCLRSAAQFNRTAFRRIGRDQRHRAIAPHKQPPSRRIAWRYTLRSTSLSLISAIASEGFSPLGQAIAQFMIVCHRYGRNGSSTSRWPVGFACIQMLSGARSHGDRGDTGSPDPPGPSL